MVQTGKILSHTISLRMV